MSEIDKSLKRPATDYVDLYQIHRWDYQTPIEETMEALHDVVKVSKARYIGASSIWRAAGAWLSSLAVAESARGGTGDRRHEALASGKCCRVTGN